MKQSSMEYNPEELRGHGPAVGVEGSGRAVQLGVFQFEKERNSPSSSNSLLTVGAGGALSASWCSSSAQD